MKREELFSKVTGWFQENMPVAQTELRYGNPYELLVAVILSAQCTDKRVNLITPSFFERFPTAHELANASVEEILEYTRTCTYPNSKSKNLLGMARMLVHEFNGKVPDNVDNLQELPGVGRKTANVIASVIYNKPALAVDTHVFRVAGRLGLTINAKTPLEAERQLVRYLPEKLLAIAHHWLILHGRYVCTARGPKCTACGLQELCKHYQKTSK